jgi:hypothetical protein
LCQTETETETEKKSARSRFTPPSQKDVSEYLIHISYPGDVIDAAQNFIAYYASKGWTVGRSPMKSWKDACVTWKKNAEKFNREKNPITPGSIQR